MTPRRRRRRGVTLVEIQVSLVVLGIALAGLCPLVVIQSKLLRRIESTPIGSDNPQVIRGQRIINGEPYTTEGDVGGHPITVLQPTPDAWVRRLGTTATFASSATSQTYTSQLTEAIADDGGATLTSGWIVQTNANAQGESCHVLAAGNSDDSATWTFNPITPGRYRVLITWPTSTSIPTDATYTLTDASSNPVSIAAVQATQVGDGPWLDLGNYSLGSSLQIRLGGSNSGPVTADAVRIGARNTVTISALAGSDSMPAGEMSQRAKVVPRP